jgi:HlyD family secretion protein
MDVPREGVARKKLIRRIAAGTAVAAAIPLITVGLYRLKPAAPTVEKATVWMDTVKRGPMTREVRGLGTLVPEEMLWIPAPADGRVERILVRPGAAVDAGTVLLVLSNPELDLAALEAEYQVKAAEAKYKDLKVQLESQRLTQQAEVARVQSEYHQAKLKADRDEARRSENPPDLDLKISVANAAEFANRHSIEEKRLTSSRTRDAQLAQRPR